MAGSARRYELGASFHGLAVLAMLGVAGCGGGDSDPAAPDGDQTPEGGGSSAPVELYLQVAAGPPGFASVADVWVSDASEAASNFDPDAPLPIGDLSALGADWRAAVSLELVGGAGAALPGLPSPTAPEDAQTEPGIATARFIMPGGAWNAGDTVRAHLAGDGWEATSQEVVIETPPAESALQARASIAHLTRDATALQQVADEMLAIDADGHAGYLYRGLALEMNGDLNGAEAALATALERLSTQSGSGDLEEPPILLLRALARVREPQRQPVLPSCVSIRKGRRLSSYL